MDRSPMVRSFSLAIPAAAAAATPKMDSYIGVGVRRPGVLSQPGSSSPECRTAPAAADERTDHRITENWSYGSPTSQRRKMIRADEVTKMYVREAEHFRNGLRESYIRMHT